MPDRSIDTAHIERQRAFSLKAFGPAQTTAGVIAHARKELDEIEDNPGDLTEWADLILLAFDGAWRSGHEPQAIIDAVLDKQAINETRSWPDWRDVDPDQPIEHLMETTDG